MPFVQSGKMIYLAGHLPQDPTGKLVTGKVGKDVPVDDAYAAARLIGTNLITTMKSAVGDLDKVKRIVKLVGFVQCEGDFTQQPAVVNGCSDLMVEVFGMEKGRHARSAVGTNALPLGVAVEIEAIIEVE
ncbi:TCP17 [Symbiodinium microadriaticum]|nr:TCP17 [Symbiodinium microadriaticum]